MDLNSQLSYFILPIARIMGMYHHVTSSFGFLSFFSWYWGLNSGLDLEPLHQPFFVMGFFEIGSHILFTWAGFEPQSS
jgi:hypothetical protein